MRPSRPIWRSSTAAKIALTTADADSKLRRALGRRYQRAKQRVHVGRAGLVLERCSSRTSHTRSAGLDLHMWSCARNTLPMELTSLRSRPTGSPTRHKLIRAAPHHVRSDILGPEHVIDDLQKSLNMVRQLKSRGVTRWYDLNRVNRQRLEDVDDDEQIDEH